MIINKKEFANRMAEISGIKKYQARENVDLFIETIIDCLKDEDVIKIHGFGRFELKTIKEKPAQNPKTGEKCIVPEHKKVKFYATDGLDKKIKE